MIFVFDLDGTLLHDDKTLSTQTRDTIETLKTRGHTVWIATGRAYETAYPYAEKLGLSGPIILNNGALIKSVDGQTIYRQRFIPKDAQKRMIEHNDRHQLPYALVSEAGIYGPKHHPLSFYRKLRSLHPKTPIQLHEFQDAKTLAHVDTYKLFTIIEDDVFFNEVLTTMKDSSEAYFTQSMKSYLDMLPYQTNKGEALEWLLKHEGYDLSEVIAFGDNDNDVQMLNVSRFSYAVNNATILAKKAATDITPLSNNEDGVAVLIQTWLEMSKEGDLPWQKKL